jgi:hypothetical protein
VCQSFDPLGLLMIEDEAGAITYISPIHFFDANFLDAQPAFFPVPSLPIA